MSHSDLPTITSQGRVWRSAGSTSIFKLNSPALYNLYFVNDPIDLSSGSGPPYPPSAPDPTKKPRRI